MQKRIILIIVSAACLLPGGCASSQTGAPEQGAARPAAEFTPLVLESAVPFDGGDPQSPWLDISLALLEPADTAPGIGNLARELFYGGQSAADYGNAVIAEYKKQYADLRGEWVLRRERPLESFNWYYAEKAESREVSVAGFMPGRERLLVLTKTTETYLGGAHGNRFTSYFVIDPAAVKRLGLDDIFASREELRLLLEAELRRLFRLPEGAPLSEAGFFEDRVELPENFSFAGDAPGGIPGGPGAAPPSVRFLWNTYEAAPYAMGAIEVSLPLGSLSRLLRE
ncbi:MAG: RsiV family protein [Treponema sp.]|jgi:hypothetical protein|nr:RsiV family protein [Treponema sp.]